MWLSLSSGKGKQGNRPKSVLTFGFCRTPERLGQRHFYPDNRRTRSTGPRHNRRRSLPAVAAGPNVEGHSRQDPTRGKTRTAAHPETLRAAASGPISSTVK